MHSAWRREENSRDELRKSTVPLVYIGGKSQAAAAVWAALGDVAHYVEPFAGSLAVLLGRPHEANRAYFSETVNDVDGLICNAWRAIQLEPEATAEHASNPVNECDLHARHVAIVRWRREHDVERLMADPAFCDPLIAGWWIWGVSCWIGGGFGSGRGPWWPDETGRLTRGGAGGIPRQIPQVSNDGQGVNHVAMRNLGTGRGSAVMPNLREWLQFLSARLRHVRVLCGDWRRAVAPGASITAFVRQGKGRLKSGIFLDPPYASSAGRNMGIYAHDSGDVSHDVAAWALEHGDDERYRIVVAGFDGEHGSRFTDAGWREVEWFKGGFLRGGMANVAGAGKSQQTRERLWLSPHCLNPDDDERQHELFEMAEAEG